MKIMIHSSTLKNLGSQQMEPGLKSGCIFVKKRLRYFCLFFGSASRYGTTVQRYNGTTVQRNKQEVSRKPGFSMKLHVSVFHRFSSFKSFKSFRGRILRLVITSGYVKTWSMTNRQFNWHVFQKLLSKTNFSKHYTKAPSFREDLKFQKYERNYEMALPWDNLINLSKLRINVVL